MAEILISGGFGFLGSHLIEALLEVPDDHIHVVDDLSSNPLPVPRLLEELGSPARLTFHHETIENFCRRTTDQRFDQIYHLASVVGPAGVLSYLGRISSLMINDAMAVADLAGRCRARLVFVSTSEVYGGGQEGLCSEDMPRVIAPESSARLEYSVGKLAAETSLLNLSTGQGLDVCIIRPFNICGPRQSAQGGFVVPRFIGQALAGDDITVFGDGTQVRAFSHVKDIVAGLLAAMQRGRRGRVYNLGTPANRCTVLELAREINALVDDRSRVVFVDPKTIYGPLYEEANDKYPDAARAIAELDWQPTLARATAIRDTFDYMRALPTELLMMLSGRDRPTRQVEAR